LQDLRAVNAVTSPMQPLQPGVPNPAMIPEDWSLSVIDLKDWFFTIFLHPDDCAHFAFSVPSVNNSKPMQRYHWVVLPQTMMSSPTICQVVVDAALKVRQSFSWIYFYHSMDDSLLAAETQNVLLTAFAKLESSFGMVPPFVARPKVWYKEFVESQWTGPVALITWGRGYACVLLSTGPRWLPAKYVKPYHELKEHNTESNARGDHAHSQGATSDVEAEKIHSG